MSKSLDFVLNRIKSNQCNNMDINEFTNACDYKFSNVMESLNGDIKDLYKNNIISLILDGDYKGKKGSKTITINYDADTEYEYFTNESCICDGTYMFIKDLMIQIMYKLFQGQTYSKASVPIDYEDSFWDYDIIYTVGDFIINSFIDNNIAPKYKLWMCCRFTTMLPIRCEFKRKIKE